MMAQRIGLALALAALAAPRAAEACSGPMPVRHELAWAADGTLLALADPEGRVVRIAGGRAEVVATEPLRFAVAGFRRDGRGLVTIAEQGSDTGDCELVSITVQQVDFAARSTTPRGRAFDIIAVQGVALSPSGTMAIVEGSLPYRNHLRVFDLTRGRAVRRLDGAQALWLDDQRIAVLRETGNIHVVRLGDRSLTQIGPVPAEGAERHFVPGDEGPAGFHFVEKTATGWSLVHVRLDGPAPVLERRDWQGPERPVSVSRDGRRVAAIDEEGRRAVVAETSGGRLVGVVSTSLELTHALLSPDGSRLATSSHERPTESEDDEAFGDASAFQPTALHIIDLTEGRIATSWGAPARTTFARRR